MLEFPVSGDTHSNPCSSTGLMSLLFHARRFCRRRHGEVGRCSLKSVGVDSSASANHCVENLRRCSLHSRERSAARGRTVRDLAQGSGSLPDGSDGPRLETGRSVHAQGRRSSPAAPKSRSRDGPHRGGEILGVVDHLRHL
jgi:hypothetical protein